MRIQKSGYKSERAAYNETLYGAGNAFMKIRAVVMVSALAFALCGCPIAGGTRFTVGGTVTGVQETGLVLQINGGDDLSFSANGVFVFGNRLANNAAYAVTIKTQPSNPSQACTVRNGSGTINKASITNVIVSCTQTGRFAYVANRQSNTVSAYAIDAGSGALVPINGSPFAVNGTAPTALTVDPNGQFLYAANFNSNDVSAYAVMPSGALTPVAGSPFAAGGQPHAVAIH
ncbi:MAG: lactonase family protein [Pseudomonadota bacterium]|nr:lactonase family protein [Pseudomonadota bacterium]